MWHKLKEQIPAVIVTAALVLAASAFMVHKITERQRAELAPLRVQNERLAAQAEDNRRQIAATTQLLKDVLKNQGGAGAGEAGVEKLNEQRLARLAQVIAERVIPAIPAPKSPAEVEAAQNEQVDKVASRLADNIRPALADALAEQKASTAAQLQASERRAHELNVGLLATQAAAQDALRLSREVSALYADSMKSQGVVMRLFSLPASLVMDAASLHLVSGDRSKIQQELTTKVAEIEKRLAEVRTLAADSGR